MQVFKIDKDGSYIGVHECQSCPITGGWLYPSYYTEDPPPEVEKFKKAVYINNQWSLVDTDYGKDIYHKETKIKAICFDDKVPDEYTLIPPFENKPCTWQDDKWVVNFEKYKEEKKFEINQAFENNFSTGHFMSTALGIEVDCRRAGMKNDLQNVQGLISYMSRNSISTINYVGYTEIKSGVTSAMLTSLLAEMEDYALLMYEKKWTLLQQIGGCNPEEELETITW